jgi:UDP-N-acetylenolpyruvoylglucosamine reductase
MSPINVSVHTTNPELRVKMLGHKKAGDVLKKIDILREGCIAVNAQSVLCPGYNDGAELDRTLADLSERADCIASVSVVPVGITKYREGLAPMRVFTKEECEYAYRDSIFKRSEKGKYVITHIVFKLNKKADFVLSYGNLKEQCEAMGGVTAENIRKAVCKTRAAKLPDPAEIGSAGSFFMNPVVDCDCANRLKENYPEMPTYPVEGGVKLSAGWLIDRCGWKEKSSERVGVYRNQALVVVNLGGATGSDVMNFAARVQESVKEKFGVSIFPEVNVID